MAEPALTLKKIIEEQDISKIMSLPAMTKKKLMAALQSIRGQKYDFLPKGINGRDLFREHHIPHHQAKKFGLGLDLDVDGTQKSIGFIALKYVSIYYYVK